jgi:putative transposase
MEKPPISWALFLCLLGLDLDETELGGHVKNVSVLWLPLASTRTASGRFSMSQKSQKRIKESWRGFLGYLKKCGLKRIDMIISDKSLGPVESIPDFYPKSKWQRCVVHYYRNVFSFVPHGRRKEVATMLKAIHAQENLEEATKKKDQISEKLENMKLGKATELVRTGSQETFSYYDFPVEHRKKIRTNNGLERIMKEIRRRTRVIGSFSDGELVA